MPAVTQLVPTLLGGVSRQVDDKKIPGQVTEVLNGYPDVTFGMLKRNGMKFTRTIKKATGKDFKKDELKDAAWFFIQRSSREAYFGCIKNRQIYVWNSITGVACTVFNFAPDYLDGTKPEDFHFLSIQDVTIITNKNKEPQMVAAPTFDTNRVGTVVIKSVEYGANYTVFINNIGYTYKTRNSDNLADANVDRLDAQEILSGIAAALPADFEYRQYKTSLEINRTDNGAFELACSGGIGGTALECFQDVANNIAMLPPDSDPGRVVKIENDTGSEVDDYYVEFKRGYWKECAAPDVATEINATTMPHELIVTDENEFTFQPIDWTDRLAGDDITNPCPSFIKKDKDNKPIGGYPINATFFYNNRFGLVSRDSVIMSQSNDPYNFFGESATTVADGDPIDVEATSVKPVTLFEVLPSAQGLLLFSRREQFLLFASDNAFLTPSNTVIRRIADYEMDEHIAPVDMGNVVAFTSKVPAYSKVLTMQTRGFEENPVVVDISKVVSEWLPWNVTEMAASPQNSFVALASRNEKEFYIYRFYNNGREDLFQAWVKWEMPGDVQAFSIFNDMLYCISQQEDQYTLGVVSINDVPLGVQVSPDMPSTPCLDLYVKPTVTYDSTTNLTKFETGYNPLTGRTPIMVWTPPLGAPLPATTLFDLIGVYEGTIHENPEDAPGYWAPLNEDFTLEGDWTEYANNLIVGYPFDFEVELPKFYYTQDNRADYTATLTINRVKFSVGKTGAVTFKLKAKGSDEWVDIQHVTDADYYEANAAPVQMERQFTVPIHQRNQNFVLKVTSDLPFPVSLVSMMWEGNYSPRFYKRK